MSPHKDELGRTTRSLVVHFFASNVRRAIETCPVRRQNLLDKLALELREDLVHLS